MWASSRSAIRRNHRRQPLSADLPGREGALLSLSPINPDNVCGRSRCFVHLGVVLEPYARRALILWKNNLIRLSSPTPCEDDEIAHRMASALAAALQGRAPRRRPTKCHVLQVIDRPLCRRLTLHIRQKTPLTWSWSRADNQRSKTVNSARPPRHRSQWRNLFRNFNA